MPRTFVRISRREVLRLSQYGSTGGKSRAPPPATAVLYLPRSGHEPQQHTRDQLEYG
jgi:hypothetical protein